MTTKAVCMAFTLALSAAPAAFAADWTVRQDAAITADQIELTQSDSENAEQAINGIRLEAAADDLFDVNQHASLDTPDLSLTQSGELAGSLQAVNFVSARSIQDLRQSVTQNTGTTILRQNITSGSGNIQAINIARAANNLHTANQEYTAQSLQLQTAQSTPAGNLQAVNYLQANSYSGQLRQSVTLDTLEYRNLGNGNLYINSIRGDSSGATEVEQRVEINRLLITDPVPGARIIINYREISPP